jgi:hypothetical protein
MMYFRQEHDTIETLDGVKSSNEVHICVTTSGVASNFNEALNGINTEY